MYCPMCGKKQLDEANYCFFCGHKIELPIQDDDSLPEKIETTSTDKNSLKDTEIKEQDAPIEKKRYLEDIYDDDEDDYDESNVGDEQKATANSKNVGIGCGFILFVIILIVILYTITSNGGQFTSSKATCNICGKSWSSGDSGGNYMSIALSGMCKNCKSNYEWSQAAMGN